VEEEGEEEGKEMCDGFVWWWWWWWR